MAFFTRIQKILPLEGLKNVLGGQNRKKPSCFSTFLQLADDFRFQILVQCLSMLLSILIFGVGLYYNYINVIANYQPIILKAMKDIGELCQNL